MFGFFESNKDKATSEETRTSHETKINVQGNSHFVVDLESLITNPSVKKQIAFAAQSNPSE